MLSRPWVGTVQGSSSKGKWIIAWDYPEECETEHAGIEKWIVDPRRQKVETPASRADEASGDLGGSVKFQSNPKRPGTKAHRRYENYKKAKTVGEFYDLGGTTLDFNNDLNRGFLTYTPQKKKKPTPPRKKRQQCELDDLDADAVAGKVDALGPAYADVAAKLSEFACDGPFLAMMSEAQLDETLTEIGATNLVQRRRLKYELIGNFS